MPYWSSSRVGAVPVGSSNSSNKSTKRSKRKGITMEDLKKQTAMRLAKEHGRVGEKSQDVGEPRSGSRKFSSPLTKAQNGSPYGRRTQPLANTPDRSYNSNPHYEEPQHQMAYQTPTRDASSISSATEKGSNAKLPHGLTVQELKEMTKARLQAEAAEKYPLGPVPSTVRVSTEYRENMNNRSSPIPPFSSGRHVSRSPYPETHSEAWENASVSTSASDYPGSESVYSNGINGGGASYNGESDVISFGRSGSYNQADWSGSAHDPPPANIAANPPNYYHDYPPNRRRAATLSPRPLSNVHEDRPVLPNRMPTIPSDFSSPGLQQNPPMRSDFAPTTMNAPRGMIGPEIGNRARTFSSPAISHTAEEFSIDPNRGVPLSNRFYSLREMPENTSTEHHVTGLSDVFRTSPSINESASVGALMGGFGSGTTSSLGLGSSSESFGRLRAQTDFGSLQENFSGERDRAATWAHHDVDLFSSDLSDDLASILKLSGAEPNNMP